MGFGGPVIKEGLILVISIVTLQNYIADLGEVCGKYPGWVKVPGPYFNTMHNHDLRYHKDGPVIQRSITSVI